MAYPDLIESIPTTPAGNAKLGADPKHTTIHAAIKSAFGEVQEKFTEVDGRLDDLEDAPGGGVTDHGALTGLADDDHTQYHTDARGDARYSLLDHDHDDVYALLGAEVESNYLPADVFAPRVIASFAASTTAARASGVVTVTATHGIPASTLDGFEIYYPGSASLAAGWYPSLSRTGTTTVTFAAAGADFSSESVNSGAAFTSEILFSSFTLPANTLSVGDSLTAIMYRGSNNPAATKTSRLKFGGSTVAGFANASTTSLCGPAEIRMLVAAPGIALSSSNFMNVGTTTPSRTAIDTTIDNLVEVSGQVDTAGVWLLTACAKFRID